MAIGDAYITRTQLGSYLGIPLDKPDTNRDFKLDTALASASEAVEDHCHRQFNTDGLATARVFQPTGALVITDDFYDPSSLLVQVGSSAPLDPTAYELHPLNGMVDGKPRPYRRIFMPYFYCTYFYGSRFRVQVTAKWGWETIPKPVIQSVYILAAQYYKLPDAPLGIAGFGAGDAGFSAVKVGEIPQVCKLLNSYVLYPISVA